MKIDNIKTFKDKRGSLTPVEFPDLPFKPKRAFFVTGVPETVRRGGHAHYKTHQYIICLTGRIRVGLHDGKKWAKRTLFPGQAVHIRPMIWDYQDFLTGRDLLAVFCSTHYNLDDYIFDFDHFLSKVKA